MSRAEKESYETEEPTSHETAVGNRIHPLAKNQPQPTAGTMGSTSSSMMQANAEEDPELTARKNKHHSPGRHLQDEAVLRAFVSQVLSESADEEEVDEEELDEFAACGGGAIGGFTGPLSGRKQRPGAGAAKLR